MYLTVLYDTYKKKKKQHFFHYHQIKKKIVISAGNLPIMHCSLNSVLSMFVMSRPTVILYFNKVSYLNIISISKQKNLCGNFNKVMQLKLIYETVIPVLKYFF